MLAGWHTCWPRRFGSHDLKARLWTRGVVSADSHHVARAPACQGFITFPALHLRLLAPGLVEGTCDSAKDCPSDAE